MFDKVECEIFGLSSAPTTGGAYALLLKEVDGNRRLPIIIGAFEAQAIAMALEGSKAPRPLTHDLLKSVIDNLSARVLEVVVTELVDNTFLAKIVVEMSGLTNEIDARPSDAIALALRAEAPIFVTEQVMEVAAFKPEAEKSGKLESFEEDLSKEESESDTEKSKGGVKTKEARISALQNILREAIENEDYERAAKIRDEIKKLSSEN
ncbi:MAG TPA: DUF151 domain-containing protein [Ignavibacteriaceae bacterium]|mgnify:CR=1 FL=1|nr:DUF151 domain-containing protein [Ignavibacteriaceae bacterium]